MWSISRAVMGSPLTDGMPLPRPSAWRVSLWTRPAGISALFAAAAVYGLAGLADAWTGQSLRWISLPALQLGIGLVLMVEWGTRGACAALLGAFGLRAVVAALQGVPPAGAPLLSWVDQMATLVSAALAAMMIVRVVRRPLILDTPRAILWSGVIAWGVACTLLATSESLTIGSSGGRGLAGELTSWTDLWLRNALGVAVGAPIALSLIGRPRADWRSRRLTVALPLTVCLAVLVLVAVELERSSDDRIRSRFYRDVDRSTSLAQERLSVSFHALKALHSAAGQIGTLSDEGLRTATQWWLHQSPYVEAMGHSVRLSLAEVPAFEELQQRTQGVRFSVHNVTGPAALSSEADLVVVRRIAGLRQERANRLLGANALSIPPVREAIALAKRTGEAVATTGFQLAATEVKQIGIVLLQALYAGPAMNEQERDRAFSGVVFVTVNLDRALGRLEDDPYLRWCLKEGMAATAGRVLAGSPTCNEAAAVATDLRAERKVFLAGRELTLSFAAVGAAVPGRDPTLGRVRSAASLAVLSLLGALLLIVTGTTRRTQRAVEAGTVDLRRQMSERAAAEQALRQSEGRLRAILDSVPLGIGFTDKDGHILECNARLCEMTGRAPARVLGSPVHTLVHADDRHLLVELCRSLVNDDDRVAIASLRMCVDDGSPLQVRVRAGATPSPDGTVLRTVFVVEDIEDEVRLRASQQALDLSETANRAKGDLIASLGHELRTPINAIVGFAQLMLMSREPQAGAAPREWAKHILDAGWHLLAMTQQTLDLARAEAGFLQVSVAPVDLSPIVASCCEMLNARAAEHQVAIRVTMPAQCRQVLADATRLKQVLTNLISNAIKYNRAGGEVVLGLQCVGEWSDITVADTGIGMTAHQLRMLFEPFNRLGRETSEVEGTGIGLVITRKLTELMGGSLDVQSVAGTGTTFTMRLRRLADALDPETSNTLAVARP